MKKNEQFIEKIGAVALNYNYYGGTDLYSEGSDEDRLLSIVKTYLKSEYEHVIESSRSWSVMYHLSHIRENIVAWLPMRGDERVLEIGSGCGAITGMLAERAGHVTCIDLSKKRSLINAYRHKDCSNVEILVGNYEDIEPELEEKYDYITLIGVLEYADSYLGGISPFVEMLRTARRHLTENGKVFIAIENQFGLKYFAGCKEDHTGKYYDGIEGYQESHGVRTFSRSGLEDIIMQAGLTGKFYYPYPDYKLSHTIYSDEFLPEKGMLTTNLRNFDADRIVTFDEAKVFDTLIENHLFPEFSNSFAVLASEKELDTFEENIPLYVKFSNERAAGFRIETKITKDLAGQKHVYKEALNQKANRHIRNIDRFSMELRARYLETRLVPNRCELIPGTDTVPQILGVSSKARDRVELEYLTGITMENYLDQLDERKQYGQMLALLREYVSLLNAVSADAVFLSSPEFRQIFGEADFGETMRAGSISNLDMIFSNIMFERETLQNGPWHILDYEWVFPFTIPVKFILYRALFYYEQGRAGRGFFAYLEQEGKTIYTELGLTENEVGIFREMEHKFQVYIIGGRASLEALKVGMPTGAIRVDEVLKDNLYLKNLNIPKVYFSCGEGFFPENMLNLSAQVEADHVVTLKIPITNNIVGLRIDPTEYPCFLHVNEIRLQMQKGIDRAVERFLVNGYLIGENSFLFDTDDAQIILDIPRAARCLVIKYQVKMLPPAFFWDVHAILKERNEGEIGRGAILWNKVMRKLRLKQADPLPEGFRYNQKKA